MQGENGGKTREADKLWAWQRAAQGELVADMKMRELKDWERQYGAAVYQGQLSLDRAFTAYEEGRLRDAANMLDEAIKGHQEAARILRTQPRRDYG